MGGGDQERDALEEVMRQPDAILEPQILDTLRRYVMRGGKPQTVVELLSDNYVGYAQMASLMCSWLSTAKEGDGEEGEGSNANGTGQSGGESNEFFFLQKLVKERFDLDKFAGVFSTGGSKPPKWLDGLAANPQGRQLIYELSGQHKNCLLLNFAIQKILYQGHESEVANVGSSLSGYFGVFHRLMVTRLRSIAAASATDLQAEVLSLAKACCQDCHSYAHMQLVVSDLSCRAYGERFRRLSQELESIAAKEHGALVWRMQPMFMRRKVSADHHRVAVLVGELLSECAVAGLPGSSSTSASHSAIHRLHQLYIGHDLPPTEPLRHPGLLKALTAALFDPGSALQPDSHAMHAHLLALAVAGIDNPRGVDTSDVESARQAIEEACSVARNSMKGVKADSDTMDMPAAAIGALHFIELTLGNLDFYRSTACLAATPVFLKLLNQIAIKHPSMRGQVVTIVSKSLHTMGNSKPTLARHFLDLLVLLLSYGEVKAIQRMADKWYCRPWFLLT